MKDKEYISLQPSSTLLKNHDTWLTENFTELDYFVTNGYRSLNSLHVSNQSGRLVIADKVVTLDLLDNDIDVLVLEFCIFTDCSFQYNRNYKMPQKIRFSYCTFTRETYFYLRASESIQFHYCECNDDLNLFCDINTKLVFTGGMYQNTSVTITESINSLNFFGSTFHHSLRIEAYSIGARDSELKIIFDSFKANSAILKALAGEAITIHNCSIQILAFDSLRFETITINENPSVRNISLLNSTFTKELLVTDTEFEKFILSEDILDSDDPLFPYNLKSGNLTMHSSSMVQEMVIDYSFIDNLKISKMNYYVVENNGTPNLKIRIEEIGNVIIDDCKFTAVNALFAECSSLIIQNTIVMMESHFIFISGVFRINILNHSKLNKIGFISEAERNVVNRLQISDSNCIECDFTELRVNYAHIYNSALTLSRLNINTLNLLYISGAKFDGLHIITDTESIDQLTSNLKTKFGTGALGSDKKFIRRGVNGVYNVVNDSALLLDFNARGDSMLGRDTETIIKNLDYAKKVLGISLTAFALLAVFLISYSVGDDGNKIWTEGVDVPLIGIKSSGAVLVYALLFLQPLAMILVGNSMRTALEGARYISTREDAQKVSAFPWLLTNYIMVPWKKNYPPGKKPKGWRLFRKWADVAINYLGRGIYAYHPALAGIMATCMIPSDKISPWVLWPLTIGIGLISTWVFFSLSQAFQRPILFDKTREEYLKKNQGSEK